MTSGLTIDLPDTETLNVYDDLFLSYTLEPLVVLDQTDLRAVKCAILQKPFATQRLNRLTGELERAQPEWVPRKLTAKAIWDYKQVWDYIDERQKKIEREYFTSMADLHARKEWVDNRFQRVDNWHSYR